MLRTVGWAKHKKLRSLDGDKWVSQEKLKWAFCYSSCLISAHFFSFVYSRQWKVEKTDQICTIYTSQILSDDIGEWSCNFQSLPFRDAVTDHDRYTNDLKSFNVIVVQPPRAQFIDVPSELDLSEGESIELTGQVTLDSSVTPNKYIKLEWLMNTSPAQVILTCHIPSLHSLISDPDRQLIFGQIFLGVALITQRVHSTK